MMQVEKIKEALEKIVKRNTFKTISGAIHLTIDAEIAKDALASLDEKATDSGDVDFEDIAREILSFTKGSIQQTCDKVSFIMDVEKYLRGLLSAYHAQKCVECGKMVDAFSLIGEIISYDCWKLYPENLRERTENAINVAEKGIKCAECGMWIHKSVLLPDNGKPVFCIHNKDKPFIGFFDYEDDEWYDEMNNIRDVTHWHFHPTR